MKTILLIEHYADNVRLVTHTLKSYDYRVVHAPDGKSGLLMAAEENPDLILLDQGLPDIEGQTLAALLKNMPETTQVPIIVVTAWPPATAERMVQSFGCDGYISKPIRPKVFPSQIAAYIAAEGSE